MNKEDRRNIREIKRDCKPRTHRCIRTPRAGKPAGRWFNETLIKGRRLCASVEIFTLAINATVHPTLTAARFGNDSPSARDWTSPGRWLHLRYITRSLSSGRYSTAIWSSEPFIVKPVIYLPLSLFLCSLPPPPVSLSSYSLLCPLLSFSSRDRFLEVVHNEFVPPRRFASTDAHSPVLMSVWYPHACLYVVTKTSWNLSSYTLTL